MCTCRRYRRAYKKWGVRRSSGGGGGGGGGVKRYSKRWWFWSHKGRKTWRHCVKKGKDSKYWKKHKCSKRPKVEKGSKWWWWSRKGRKVWKQCKSKGKKSDYWKKHKCSAGRCVDRL